MNDLQVPTVALAAEVLFADGQVVLGRIFVPAAASTHPGPMRAEEWMNDPEAFFPLLPDQADKPVIVNKRQVLVLVVSEDPGPGEPDEAGFVLERRIVVECGGRRVEGKVSIDMPEHQCRVLDYLNTPKPFLTLRDEGRNHLIQKSQITRVTDVRED